MTQIITVTLEDIYETFAKNLYDITVENDDGYGGDKEMADMFTLLKAVAAAQQWEYARRIVRKAFYDGYASLLIPNDLIDPDEDIEEVRIIKWAWRSKQPLQRHERLIMVLTGSEICM